MHPSLAVIILGIVGVVLAIAIKESGGGERLGILVYLIIFGGGGYAVSRIYELKKKENQVSEKENYENYKDLWDVDHDNDYNLEIDKSVGSESKVTEREPALGVKTENPQLFLIDASSYIYAAYFVLPPMSRSDGVPVNVVYGITNLLIELTEKININKKTNYVLVVFDCKRDSFRKKIYFEYKNNELMNDDLIKQSKLIEKIPDAFNMSRIKSEKIESIDLIASYAKKSSSLGFKTTIISQSKTLWSLLDDNINIVDPFKKREISFQYVKDELGIPPSKVNDIFALSGCYSVNIPKIKGIDTKVAAELIKKFESVENLLQRINEITEKKIKELLIENTENILKYKKILSFQNVNDLPIDIKNLKFKKIDSTKLLNFLNYMEFNRMKEYVTKLSDH